MTVAIYDRWPKRMLIGEGAGAQLAEEVKLLGASKVLFLTDTGIANLPFILEMEEALRAAGLELCVYDQIRPHPTDKNVEEAVAAAKAFGVEVIVSVGGGSPMDCARGIKAVLAYGGDIRDHMLPGRKIQYNRKDMLPHIAVPTTAGTGGEVAGGGAIYGPDLETGEMMEIGLGDSALVPDIAVIDPLLTISLPPLPTAFTGMDVLTHAVECVFSTKDFALSDGLSYEAISMVEEHLRNAVHEPQNMAAREAMLVAAMMATVAFGQTRLGLCHSMAMSLSVIADIPHGTGNALLLPHIYRYNATARPERALRIAWALGVPQGLSTEETVKQGTDKITQLLIDTGLPVWLDDTKFTKEDIPRAAVMAKHCGFTYTNPIIPTEDEIAELYMECFK